MLVVSDEVLLKSAIERLDVLINEVCRSIYDLTDTYYTISIEKENELWSKACELSYEDNEHLRRTLLYKQDLLKVYEERLAQIEL